MSKKIYMIIKKILNNIGKAELAKETSDRERLFAFLMRDWSCEEVDFYYNSIVNEDNIYDLLPNEYDLKKEILECNDDKLSCAEKKFVIRIIENRSSRRNICK